MLLVTGGNNLAFRAALYRPDYRNTYQDGRFSTNDRLVASNFVII
jgi:hypothetical protein